MILQLFNKFYDRVSTINHNSENDPELILIVDFYKIFAVAQSVSAFRSTVNVMIQTTTLVVFAATFAIAINNFKDLTGACRELCSNWNILSFDESPSQIGRLQVIFEPRFNLMVHSQRKF